MIAGRHIGLDAAELVQRFAEQRLGDAAGVDSLARKGEDGAGDDVRAIAGVFLRLRPVARCHIVDQAFVEGPGVHLALPVVDDGVAEAIDLALLVGDAGGPPRIPGGCEGRLGRIGDKPAHRALQIAGRDQRVLVNGVSQVGIVREHVALGRRGKGGCRQRH